MSTKLFYNIKIGNTKEVIKFIVLSVLQTLFLLLLVKIINNILCYLRIPFYDEMSYIPLVVFIINMLPNKWSIRLNLFIFRIILLSFFISLIITSHWAFNDWSHYKTFRDTTYEYMESSHDESFFSGIYDILSMQAVGPLYYHFQYCYQIADLYNYSNYNFILLSNLKNIDNITIEEMKSYIGSDDLIIVNLDDKILEEKINNIFKKLYNIRSFYTSLDSKYNLILKYLYKVDDEFISFLDGKKESIDIWKYIENEEYNLLDVQEYILNDFKTNVDSFLPNPIYGISFILLVTSFWYFLLLKIFLFIKWLKGECDSE